MISYRNEVILSGTLAKKFEYQQHYDQVRKKSEAILEVRRKSGRKDQVIIQASGWKTEVAAKLQEGDYVYVKGEIRMYGYIGEDGEKHTKIYVHIDRIWKDVAAEQDSNEVKLVGAIVKKAELRKLPKAQKIQGITVATKCCSQSANAYIPVIAQGRMASRVCENYDVRYEIRLTGRYQSRNYKKKYPNGKKEEKTTYEVSITKLDI